MTNEFVNYYTKVQEDAQDMVNEMFDELVDSMKEESNYSYNDWERLNESFITEWNNHLDLDLRESIEIIEQSVRPIDDTALYVHSGDLKEQVKSMAYWTYQNDLRAEFRLALKEELKELLPQFESKVENLEKQIDEVNELITIKEADIESLEVQIDSNNENEDINKNEIESQIEQFNLEIESYQEQQEKLEAESESFTNAVENIDKSIGEL